MRPISEELLALYATSSEGVVLADLESKRFLHVNAALRQMLGYAAEGSLSLSVMGIHPPETLSGLLETFEAMKQGRLKCLRDVPCLRENGTTMYVDIAVIPVVHQERPCLFGIFHDVTEQHQIVERLLAERQFHRLIVDRVGDIIWTADFPPGTFERCQKGDEVAGCVDAILSQWRFSFLSPSAERVFGYTVEEARRLALRDIAPPEAISAIRRNLIENLPRSHANSEEPVRQRPLELKLRAKDGSPRWCEALGAYLHDETGAPVGVLGITRDITERRLAEQALGESEITLRLLFENLPDFVILVDRDARISFINHGQPGASRQRLMGAHGFSFLTPEHQPTARHALERTFVERQPQSCVVQDVFGQWWASRLVPLEINNQDGAVEQVIIICTDITQERLTAEAVKKEQRLLRQLLDLHERERRLVAYDIHDGFAQQLTGALYRLEGFREALARNNSEAWKDFQFAVELLSRSINEARRLISGLRPPVLDELGIVEAVQYLVYERRKKDGPEIEFEHDGVHRLAPPLENAVFRIVQESLHNACRHGYSDKIHIALAQRDGRIYVDVRDDGVGFDPNVVEEQRFGLQGIRERVRLLDGRISIESAPNEGTHVSVELPLVGRAEANP